MLLVWLFDFIFIIVCLGFDVLSIIIYGGWWEFFKVLKESEWMGVLVVIVVIVSCKNFSI